MSPALPLLLLQTYGLSGMLYVTEAAVRGHIQAGKGKRGMSAEGGGARRGVSTGGMRGGFESEVLLATRVLCVGADLCRARVWWSKIIGSDKGARM